MDDENPFINGIKEVGKDFAVAYSASKAMGTAFVSAEAAQAGNIPRLADINSPMVEGASRVGGSVFAVARGVAQVARVVQKVSIQVIEANEQVEASIAGAGIVLNRTPSYTTIASTKSK